MCVYIYLNVIFTNKTVISSRENVIILQTALPYLCTILYLFIIVIIIMGISNYSEVEICLAPSGSYQKMNSLKCLKSVLIRNLLAYCKKGKQRETTQHQKPNTIPILSLYLTCINLLLLFWFYVSPLFMCFYGSKLSLSAIYKNVNSKLLFIKNVIFFNLYLHNCSSNLFFLYGFKYSDIFCCS